MKLHLSYPNEMRHLQFHGRDVAAINWYSLIGDFGCNARDLQDLRSLEEPRVNFNATHSSATSTSTQPWHHHRHYHLEEGRGHGRLTLTFPIPDRNQDPPHDAALSHLVL